jgi:hypothetical protein
VIGKPFLKPELLTVRTEVLLVTAPRTIKNSPNRLEECRRKLEDYKDQPEIVKALKEHFLQEYRICFHDSTDLEQAAARLQNRKCV